MIQRLRNKLKRKLNNNSGMSLAELLIATLLMSLVGGAMYMVISLGFGQYTESIRQSESQELFSTIQISLSNELRYTSSISLFSDDTKLPADLKNAGYKEVKTFFSVTYAIKSSETALVSLDADGSEAEYGELALGNNGDYNRLFGSSSYPEGLKAKAKVYYNEGTNRFRVNISILANDKEYITDKTFEVKPLNNLKINK